MTRVLAVMPPEALGELLAEIALDQWPAASVGDVLPALYVLDPDEADDPYTAIAMDRAGSWAGLLALSARELIDQPFVQARPVLTTLFTAAFLRLTPEGAAEPADEPEPQQEETQEQDQGQGQEEREPELEQRVNGQALWRPKVPAAVPSAPSAPAEPPPPPPAPPMPPQDLAPPGLAPLAALGITNLPPLPPGPPPGASSGRSMFEPLIPQEPPEPEEPEEVDLYALIESAFSGLDDKTWAVAQNRVFTDSPGAVDELAKLFAVSTPEIEEVEADLRVRLKKWLVSDDARPYRTHLADVQQALGKAAPKSRLVEAAEWHGKEIRALEVPGWQFVLASLPGHRLMDGWIVDGDLDELHERTRHLIINADRPPTLEQAIELVVGLGIHAEVARDWLANVPRLRILNQPPAPAPPPAYAEPAPVHADPAPLDPAYPNPAPAPLEAAFPEPAFAEPAFPEPAFPEPAPMPPAPEPELPPPFPAPEPAAAELTPPGGFPVPFPPPDGPPVPLPPPDPAAAVPLPPPPPPAETPEPPSESELQQEPEQPQEQPPGQEPASKGFRPFKDVSFTRRCFRQPDGRWWLRIDLTGEHLNGAECPLPSGFAAYLGLSPGQSRTVSSTAGDLTMTWQSRPVVESLLRLLEEVEAKEGGHLFLTLSEEGMLRARHLEAAGPDVEPITQALRLVGYTAPDNTADQASRVIATRIGMAGSVGHPDLLVRLRERGDRDLLSLLS
ncbi:hypothetical protein DP939_18645 [Spongiactinospora rosea]|uniref:Uncharacterized protein n=1 Tax=Spongiactinospora rosea TaxID=2248750 RepID=A0A366LZB9_9ACTN|nr:hypothetical protein [Spongiactinospora rosea]RBQ18522.1 hypothetical protein DP939_18645 [Spongiactinospora rosea]